MIRSYEFYEENYKITRMEISRIEKIVADFEKGIVDEEKLGSLGLNGLKFCIAEGKIDTLIKFFSSILAIQQWTHFKLHSGVIATSAKAITYSFKYFVLK